METINQAGDRKILYIFGPATLFPAVSFLEDSALSSWFYVAHVDTDVYVISYDALSTKLKETDGSNAYSALLRQTLTHVHELLLQVSDHTRTDSVEKLISVLLFLLTYHTKKTSKTWRLVQFPVTHQLLAEMTGLARETVSVVLKDLSNKKLLRYRHKAKLELNYNHLSKESHA
jgi:CRP-like cAMP-binding protein